jgi:hypothetical protein
MIGLGSVGRDILGLLAEFVLLRGSEELLDDLGLVELRLNHLEGLERN